MEMLGSYELTTALSNKNAGSCRWCFAKRNGREYFIKEFLEPKYPYNDNVSSWEKIERKIKKCNDFEEKKTRIYKTINQNSDGNAVRIMGIFREGTKYYMVMPKINALKMDPEDIAKLPDDMKRRLCAVIAHAISCLHAGHFVHADVKHTNVMIVASQSGALTAKVIDYDAGFFEEDAPTNPEAIAGDVVYFSPEAYRAMHGEEMVLTCKMDVFALGVLLHQYMTGALPEFDETQFESVGDAVAAGEKVKVSWDIPVDIHRLICTMLESDPSRRPTSKEVYERLIRPIRKERPEPPKPEPPKPEIPKPNPPKPEPPKPGSEFKGDAPARSGWWGMDDLS